MTPTLEEIKIVANHVLNGGYRLTLQNGFGCRISKVCTTKLPKLIEKEILNNHRKKFLTQGTDVALSEINVMCDHYFPRCVAVVFTKRVAVASKKNRLRFGLVIDLKKDLAQSPENLITQLKIYVLVTAIETGKQLNQERDFYEALYGFIGRQVYENDHHLKCIIEAASRYTTPQIAALLT